MLDHQSCCWSRFLRHSLFHLAAFLSSCSLRQQVSEIQLVLILAPKSQFGTLLWLFSYLALTQFQLWAWTSNAEPHTLMFSIIYGHITLSQRTASTSWRLFCLMLSLFFYGHWYTASNHSKVTTVEDIVCPRCWSEDVILLFP